MECDPKCTPATLSTSDNEDARYFMAIIGCFGVAIICGFTGNMGIAIVAMVNHTAIRSNRTDDSFQESVTVCEGRQDFSVANNSTTSKDGPFLWDESLQSLILSAYLWGSVLTQLPGGRLAELYSPTWVVNGAVIVNAIACILSPVAAQIHYSLLIVMRIVQGLAGGVSFPAMHVMIANWAPPSERSVISSIIYGGSGMGNAIAIALSGPLATNFGWAAIFYVEGGLSLVWSVTWWLLIRDSASEQTLFITQHEKDYIARSLRQTITKTKKKLPVPWKQVIRSTPFWTITVAQCCTGFGWNMLLSESPTYISQILQFDFGQSALFSALPYLSFWIFATVLGKSLSYAVFAGCITSTVSRKIGNLFGSFVPMCCLIGISYAGCNTDLAVALLIIGVACFGGVHSGSFTNHIDIASNFAGTLMALTNVLATIFGLIATLFVGVTTQGNQTMQAWQHIFHVTAGLFAVEVVVYTIFGTAEEEPWNVARTTDPEEIVSCTTNPKDQNASLIKESKGLFSADHLET